MIKFLKEVYYVSWGDLRYMRHNIVSILIMSLVSPLLYLFTFGYGLSSNMVESELPYIAFIIPGIVALSSLNSSFSSTASRLNIQRIYYRSFDDMMLCPLRQSSIVIGKASLGVIRGLISCSIIYAIGLLLAPQLQINPIFILAVILSCYTFSLLGLTASLLAKTHQNLSMFSSLVILPMTFLCGTFFSLDILPLPFQALLYTFPLTHSSNLIRASSLGMEIPWFSLLALLAFLVVFYVLNLHLLKTRKI